jgi:hypothetical protein
MESYIDFIKKYNNEKSISSSTDSEFDNFLKGGANIIKGGFPPVYSVDSQSAEDSFREYSPNLKISDVLEKNSKTPFLNINSNQGGFLNLFTGSQSTNVEKPEKTTNVEKSENVESTSVVLPAELSVVTLDEQNSSTGEMLQEGGDLASSSVIIPENIEILTIESEKNDNIQNGGSREVIDNLFLRQFKKPQNEDVLEVSSVNLPSEMEIISILEELSGGDEGEDDLDLDTTVDLPDQLEVVSIKVKQSNTNVEEEQVGGDDDAETSVALPENLEVVSMESETNVQDEQVGGDDDAETSVVLPDNLEVVSMESETNVQDEQVGGDEDEKEDDEDEKEEEDDDDVLSSVALPDHLEVISVNRNEILESVDTDTSVLNILDDIEIMSVNSESISNIFLKNFKKY